MTTNEIRAIDLMDIKSIFLDKKVDIDPPQASKKPLNNWRMEDDDGPIFRYIYQIHKPKRHLEFGTWQGWGARLCLESSDASVWTINLPDGELTDDGKWAYSQKIDKGAVSLNPGEVTSVKYADDEGLEVVYHRTDAGSYIGHLYREKNLGNRVCQIYADSKLWDISPYPPDFFDSVLVDGGHQCDVVISDTRKALSVLRPGGIIMWHDFCPLPEIRDNFESVKGVAEAIDLMLPMLKLELKTIAWIKPSWILIGIKK